MCGPALSVHRLQQGEYYGPDGFYELKGQVTNAGIAKKAKIWWLRSGFGSFSEKLSAVRWGA
jgi:hypothetical protein